MKPVSFLHKIA